ncbi:deoxyribonuclease IV [Mycoplasma phocoenae]|uniref:Probable endonuclease 4 n=1 Tax=Mycoplasma phocoenae TaxID=754517 RepID=A0A858U6J1_9MOLU|nr:deoxyribonuclease IV [Mycoplasma phocoenae]QJG67077.1 deoxyribonuclease IV [Mycoplasma phocoenae]
MLKLGSHISFKSPDYLLAASEETIDNNANVMMIYLGAPQTAKRVDKIRFKLKEYIEKYSQIIKPEDIIIHAPYIINASNPEKNVFAINFLAQEIERMNYIGAKYIVLHPGAHTVFDREKSIKTLIESMKTLISITENVVICLETMAGKGTEIFTNLAEMKYILESINSDRVQMCLDTCHIWDAGYNIKHYEEFKNELKQYNLFNKIKVIHLNDSLNDLNSHKDRHANINKGFIGLETLAKFVHDPEFDNVPIILETPWTDQGPIYKEEIAMLLNKK